MNRFAPPFVIMVTVLPCLLLIGGFRRYYRGRPKPRVLIVKLFALGLAAPLLAAAVELITVPLCHLLPTVLIVPAKAFFGIAFVEELVKFGGMTLAARRGRGSGMVLDGAIYGISIAIGFALVENFMYIIGSESAIRVALIRGFTAVPLHALAGSLLGIAWGNGSGVFFWGAVAIHGLYNWVLMETRLSTAFIGIILIGGWSVLIIFFRRTRRKTA